MGYKNYRKEKEKDFVPGEMDTKGQKDSGMPTPEDKGVVSSTLQSRAMKDLKFASLTVKANPGEEASRASDPYAILNSNNPVKDASYPGSPTFSGNTVQQLLNNSNTKLLNYFDTGALKLRFNYLYLAIDPTAKNRALNLQMGSAFEEALSFGYSEQLIQLPFYTNQYTTTMPKCDEYNRMPISVFYQTMLQNTAAIAGKYLQTRSLQKMLTDMSFNREAPFIHDLFGKLRKASFIAIINGISNYIVGEYFDTYWHKQMATLSLVPSRKSNAMDDPLLTICAVHKVPSVKIYSPSATPDVDDPIFDSSTYKATVNGVEYTAEQLCMAIIEALDQRSILTWARKLYNRQTDVTSTAYFNNLVDLLEAYKSMMTRFSGDMSDFRTFLDLMNRSKLNTWEKGKIVMIPKGVEDYAMDNNVLCNNVFSSYLASAHAITYDESTFRWKFFSMWNRYYGVPSYDLRDGGSFLTFSVRELPEDSDYTSTKWLIPKLFSIDGESVIFTTRLGFEVPLNYYVYNNTTLNSDPILSRLNPLSVPDLTIRMPRGSVLEAGNIPSTASSLYKLINTVFGWGQVEVSDGVYDTCLSSDNVCFVDIEMDDISNAMISFSRAFCPFRVATSNTDQTIGFLDVKSKLA